MAHKKKFRTLKGIFNQIILQKMDGLQKNQELIF